MVNIIREARSRAGMTQVELARAAGTSHQTIGRYERGEVSPTLATASRILKACGMRLSLESGISWETRTNRGRPFHVPNRLPTAAQRDLGPIELPLHIAWSGNQKWDTSNPQQRARLYEIVLREGRPEDIEEYVDGALLQQSWPDMALPRAINEAWQPLIELHD